MELTPHIHALLVVAVWFGCDHCVPRQDPSERGRDRANALRVAPPPAAQKPESAPPAALQCPPVDSLDLTPDGAVLTVLYDNEAVIVDTRTWSVRGRIELQGRFSELKISPKGTYVAVANTDGDVPTGSIAVHRTGDVGRVALFEKAFVDPMGGSSFGFSANEETFALARRDGRARVEVWNLSPLKRRFALPLADETFDLDVLDEDLMVFRAAEVHAVRLDTGKVAHRAPYTQRVVSSPDGRWLAMPSGDGLQLWNPRTGKTNRARDRGCQFLEEIVFSPDSRSVAVGGFDFMVCIFETLNGRLKTTLPAPRPTKIAQEDEGYRTPSFFSPDGATLVVHTLFAYEIFDVRSGRELGAATSAPWHLHAHDLLVVPRKRDEALLVTSYGNVRARIAPKSLLSMVQPEPELDGVICAVSTDGERMARYVEGSIEIVATETGRVTPLQGSHGVECASLATAFDPRGRYLLNHFVSDLSIWDVETGKRIALPRLCAQPLAVSPSSRVHGSDPTSVLPTSAPDAK